MAQKLSKEEEKALKNEIRDLMKNPEKYQKMKAQDDDVTIKIREDVKKILLEQTKLKEAQQTLNASIEVEKSLLAKFPKKESKKLTTTNNITNEKVIPPPVIFRVQIGAYQNQYLAKLLTNQSNFLVEDKDAQMKRYVLGRFTKYEEAQAFAQFLNQRGAISFVVAYFTEKRMENIKELPENVRPKEKQ
ncbi:MAG: hypothetical protein EAZ85_03645 [Bacteroidetes bacterium]|nr:MAG: hypothetical protein EAZ85_03645 [Bacteroidota bacterium]TAG89590.1 MAG: hypothetical protein EAZ20_06190 [Bacteroidota bacterium]